MLTLHLLTRPRCLVKKLAKEICEKHQHGFVKPKTSQTFAFHFQNKKEKNFWCGFKMTPWACVEVRNLTLY